MRPDRPPVTDAEFTVVRGPWPRWALNLSLYKLLGWGVAVSAAAILLSLGAILALRGFG